MPAFLSTFSAARNVSQHVAVRTLLDICTVDELDHVDLARTMVCNGLGRAAGKAILDGDHEEEARRFAAEKEAAGSSEQAPRSIHAMKISQKLAETVERTHSLAQILHAAVALVGRRMHCRACSVFILEPGDKQPSLRAVFREEPSPAGPRAVQVDES